MKPSSLKASTTACRAVGAEVKKCFYSAFRSTWSSIILYLLYLFICSTTKPRDVAPQRPETCTKRPLQHESNELSAHPEQPAMKRHHALSQQGTNVETQQKRFPCPVGKIILLDLAHKPNKQVGKARLCFFSRAVEHTNIAPTFLARPWHLKRATSLQNRRGSVGDLNVRPKHGNDDEGEYVRRRCERGTTVQYM